MPTLRKLKNTLRHASPRSRKLFNQFIEKYGNDNFVLNMGPAVPDQWVLLRKPSKRTQTVSLRGGGGGTFEEMLASAAFKESDRISQGTIKHISKDKMLFESLKSVVTFEINRYTEDSTDAQNPKSAKSLLVCRTKDKKLTITFRLGKLTVGYKDIVYVHNNIQTKRYAEEDYKTLFKTKDTLAIRDILHILLREWNIESEAEFPTSTILIIGMQIKELTKRHLSQLVRRLELHPNVQICLVDMFAPTDQPAPKRINYNGKNIFICSVRDTIAGFGRSVPKEGWFDYVLMDRFTIQHISSRKGSKYETACMGKVLKNGGRLFLQELEHRVPDESFTAEEIEEAKTHFSPKAEAIKLEKTHFPNQQVHSTLKYQPYLQILADQADATTKLLYPKITATVGHVKAVSGLLKTSRVSIINNGWELFDAINLFNKEKNKTPLLTLVNDSGWNPLNDLKLLPYRVKSLEQIDEILQSEHLKLVKEHKKYIFFYKDSKDTGPDGGEAVVAEWVKWTAKSDVRPPPTACEDGDKDDSGVCRQHP